MKIEYWEDDQIKIVICLSRSMQKLCAHEWRDRVKYTAGWKSVCKHCGSSAR